ncbi:MAG: 6-phospho-beta-glucosidase [Chloroflexota bacterium]
MKVTVIGGGSSYTPELVNGFLERLNTFPLSELWLMDILPERLELVGGFAQRMVAAKGQPFSVQLTTDRRQAIHNAHYVITQLRVGWMQARREDEYLGRRHGLVGQETTGLGGMAKALRTIPVMLDIANDMRDLSPGALLINFTNPAGLVTQALADHAPDVPAVGVCNVPLITKMKLLAELEARQELCLVPEQAQLDSLGLNHLTWYRGLSVDGEDLWPQVMASFIAAVQEETDPEWNIWDTDTLQMLGMIPNRYLRYFYYTDRMLAAQQKWPPSRAEEVMAVEKELLAQYAEPDRTEPPDTLMKRGGAYYSTVATQILNAHYNDTGETHIVNVPQRGAVSGWPAEWVLEMPCRVSRAGLVPLPVEPLPPVAEGLLAQVKAYEMLTVQAAVYGDRSAAYQALLAHPLGPPADQVQAVLEDMLATHRRYLPQFVTTHPHPLAPSPY